MKLPLTDIPGVKREYHFDLKGVYKKGTTMKCIETQTK